MDAKKARWVMDNLRNITRWQTLVGYLVQLGDDPTGTGAVLTLPQLRQRVCQRIQEQGLAS